MTKHDLVIIGAGVAGYTAAIYAARAGVDFTLLEQDGCGGGQITSAHLVENYPGVPRIRGADLADRIKQQAESFGVCVSLGTVQEIHDLGCEKEILLTDGDTIAASAVIAATGAVPRKLGLDNEEAFAGRGISYCAICDGAFFAGRDVAVVGGGDTAVEDAIYLSSVCKSVTLIHRRDTLRSPKLRADELALRSNVTVRYNSLVTAVRGDGRLEKIIVESIDRRKIERLPVDGLFVAVGTEPAADYLNSLPLQRENGYIIADESGITSVDGIFVAGDLRKKPLRQVVTAASDGANAASSAVTFLRSARK